MEASKLSNKNLEEKIYETIKSAIINRELAPGTKLSEETLAKTLDVSRTPIRSALRRLTYEMYVQIIPKRGAFVNQPSPKEVKDVFEMRRLIEDYAVKKACESEILLTESNKIEGLIASEQRAYESQDLSKVLVEVHDIHIEIAKLSNNQILISQLRELISLTNIYLAFYSEMRLDIPESPKEHLDILEAIKSRNSILAREKMSDHIDGILSRLNFDLIQRPFNSVEKVVSKYYS